MKFIVLFLLVMFTLTSCMNKNINDVQKERFLELMGNGYKFNGHIYSRSKGINTCVYHEEPNKNTKKAIESFYNLLHQEFKVFNPPQYKKSLEMCLSNTDLYINLMDYREMSAESLTIAASSVFARHNLVLNKQLKPSLGQVVLRSKKNIKIISFISIMQIIDEEKYEASYLVPTIIEELFQAIALGRDIDVRKKPMSKLHEDRIRFKTGLPYKFEKFERYNPVALCGFDIWYLILIYGDEERSLSYDDYIRKFLMNYSSIKERSLKIEKNPAYKDLFDPRCSGKNTGINTKIGIQ